MGEPSSSRAASVCPALVIHGDDDHISRWAVGERLARELHAPFLTIAGGGHAPQARWPVLVDRAIRDFVRGLEVSP
jgi:pimeloyl-ACP methyl ester carboxylesterase